MKKVLIFIILIIIGIFAFFFYDKYYKKERLTDILGDINEEFIIDNYSIFGTHLNISGCIDKKIDNIELVLKNKDEEIILNSNLDYTDGKTCFYISKNNNDSIYLEDLKVGDYLLLLKSGEEYYTLKNGTEYNNLEYYTITRNNSNNKIEILFDKIENKNYVEFKIKESNLPDNVYDIAIDPGHGGKDVGTSTKIDGVTYYESEYALKVSLKLKEELENIGLKVKLTRDSDTFLSNYGKGGRAVIPNEFNTKYSISLHLNSSIGNQKYGGVEVYTPNDIDLTFAKLLAKNIAYEVNYSKKETDKIGDGVYYSYFKKSDVDSARNSMLEKDKKPYDIKEGIPYMYMIREVGGVHTGAYVDGRNDSEEINFYYNSNKTAEPYLIEMAYMNYDLKKIVNKPEVFSKAILNSINEYLNLS